MHSIKSLLPALCLIALYFIADEFFGPAIGTLCAFVLGIAEFTYTRIREKIYDKTILYITLFFCIPGTIAIFSDSSLITRLQPAIVETAMGALLAFFAFSQADMTSGLPVSYRKNFHLTPDQQQILKNKIKILFILVCIHTLFSYIALLTFPENIASFISGPLLYLLIGLFFIMIFIQNRVRLRAVRKEEWLPVVDEKGKIIGKAPRSVCHSGSKLLHPVVHLHITNERHEFFLQKRSMKKDLLPGYWDTAVGGHIGLNEPVEQALKRETFEELGITDFEVRFLGKYVWESTRERELVFSFLCTRYDRISIDNDEVDEGHFWSKHEIEAALNANRLTPNFIHEYNSILKKI